MCLNMTLAKLPPNPPTQVDWQGACRGRNGPVLVRYPCAPLFFALRSTEPLLCVSLHQGAGSVTGKKKEEGGSYLIPGGRVTVYRSSKPGHL